MGIGGGGTLQPRAGHSELRVGMRPVPLGQAAAALGTRTGWLGGGVCLQRGQAKPTCQPGRPLQLAGPEKLPVKPQPFETLTNKVFFSFEVE